jgi:2-polyprenyl-3-methyl-5-hydroxy-6-metoxy-1,4-benzoquinol methylase
MVANPKSVDGSRETERFARLDFDAFKRLATDDRLSDHERIGFPDGFREGFEEVIWADIQTKLSLSNAKQARILDIGPGCGPLPRRLIAVAEAQNHHVVLIDHAEMLDRLPSSSAVSKIPGRFPDNIDEARAASRSGEFDAIITYSVLHAVVMDANPFFFLDHALSLLAPGGHLLIGDIPNHSKLRRFLASEAGRAFHREYMQTDENPDIPAFAVAEDRIDDGIVIGMLMRARLAGFDAYILPQAASLPLSNRREDLLFVRP